jgi:hypothetical protein
MKKIFLTIVLIFGFSVLFSGCYTVLWIPEEDNLSNNDTNDAYESSSFYDTDYYGGYGSFYETTWWAANPVYFGNPKTENINQSTTKNRTNNKTAETEIIRNGNGRGNTDSNPGTTNPQATTTTVAPPPPPPSPTTNTGSSSSGNSSSTSSSGSSSTKDNRNSGSNSGDTRNNSGSRNSDGGRR